jgi:hypothetical protein
MGRERDEGEVFNYNLILTETKYCDAPGFEFWL